MAVWGISMKKQNTLQKPVRNDIILITILLGSAILFLACYYLFFHKDGAFIQITTDGKVYKTLPLNEDTTITISGFNNGSNTLQIKNGYASVINADCPDKLCQKQKKIHYKGESIVCLPNKVVISVISKEEPGLDGITY